MWLVCPLIVWPKGVARLPPDMSYLPILFTFPTLSAFPTLPYPTLPYPTLPYLTLPYPTLPTLLALPTLPILLALLTLLTLFTLPYRPSLPYLPYLPYSPYRSCLTDLTYHKNVHPTFVYFSFKGRDHIFALLCVVQVWPSVSGHNMSAYVLIIDPEAWENNLELGLIYNA